MFENLTVFEKRYEELNRKLCDPVVACDPEQSRELMKEVRSIEPIVEKYREFRKTEEAEDEAKQILEDESDRELRHMAEEEISTARVDRERIGEELKLLLLPRDPNDEKNVIVEIRGGAGGEEAALFSGVLYRMYSMYAQSRGWRTEIMNANETELGGFKEISFMITGDGAYSRLKYESGVHRVQRVPETEQQGRIHTSTATVAVLPEVEEVEFELDPNDLKIDTFRSSGAGGQHINKTSSAIRVTHLPTGMVVECQDERSQYKNKDRALKILRSRLYEIKQKEQDDQVAAERRSQVGTGDRSERIRTYNYPQGRVTDHRIGLTLYRLDAVLNGDLDEILDALIAADRAEKLKNSAENGTNSGE
ncbi:peptide chain release factor 1 [Caproicibacter fermentans]|uniref:Peptide chain release factor 1 n=1 Tax=Caproicibacter fermentans TaxID=2576756 RepID=A0A7G8TD09_9FIRM|nr:peptide chain release factor 1 [Caproicibacter fermentans]QNK41500.1 peptide chain release factor 1 [Caproicibacter fermentans]